MMEQIRSIQQIRDLITDIRDLKKGYVTNFYLDEVKHGFWVADESFCYERCAECYVLLHKNDGFNNVFYIATTLDAVTAAFQHLTGLKNCVLDVVSRAEEPEELQALAECGFSVYNKLYRMNRSGKWEVKVDDDENVIEARQEDIAIIQSFLYRDFDMMSEQLPTTKELEERVKNRQILVYKKDYAVLGFIIFEVLGKTWYLRYWYTSPKNRNLRVGAKLLTHALSLAPDAVRQILWVIAANDNAIKRYEHYGFKKENMYDYVLIKN